MNMGVLAEIDARLKAGLCGRTFMPILAISS